LALLRADAGLGDVRLLPDRAGLDRFLIARRV
jgi:hypothetical protein